MLIKLQLNVEGRYVCYLIVLVEKKNRTGEKGREPPVRFAVCTNFVCSLISMQSTGSRTVVLYWCLALCLST